MLGDVAKDKILLIGDSSVDVAGANASGIKCLIVDWFGQENHDELRAAGAAHIATTHAGALGFIKENF